MSTIAAPIAHAAKSCHETAPANHAAMRGEVIPGRTVEASLDAVGRAFEALALRSAACRADTPDTPDTPDTAVWTGAVQDARSPTLTEV
eukprot:scaffold8778_cov78-Phaeocystis_antarctica.AAC.2